MGLASEQTLSASRAQEAKTWSSRRLFPVASVVKGFTKAFTTVFESLLAFVVLIIGFSELLHHPVSRAFYVIAVILMVIVFIERRPVTPVIEPKV
jgi:uncharacterized membrane protein